MRGDEIRRILEDVRSGQLDVDAAAQSLSGVSFVDLGFAKLDTGREERNGFPEVVFCQGKLPEHAVAIIERLAGISGRVLATRAAPELYERVKIAVPTAVYHTEARVISVQTQPVQVRGGTVLVVAAGTADLPVAEEAAVTAEMMGNPVSRIYDVGVAGLHRLLAHMETIRAASVVIVVAGMEAALASVVGGLVRVPVIAVPTSVGYGASFGGLSALLGMLNSCASGVTVVNIDNGFGAGYAASMINHVGGR